MCTMVYFMSMGTTAIGKLVKIIVTIVNLIWTCIFALYFMFSTLPKIIVSTCLNLACSIGINEIRSPKACQLCSSAGIKVKNQNLWFRGTKTDLCLVPFYLFVV